MPVTTQTQHHFKNLAARSEADLNAGLPERSAFASRIEYRRALHLFNPAVGADPKLTKQIPIKVRAHAWHPRPLDKPPGAIQPLVLVPGRKLDPDERVIHLQAVAGFASADPKRHQQAHNKMLRMLDVPCGFRTPSAKAKNWRSTSLIEQASIRAGLAPERAFEPSARGLKKQEATQQTKALIHLERLMRDNEARAIQARNDDQKAKWFVGKVMAAMEGSISHEWLESIVPEKLTAFYTRRFKYMNAPRRARYELLLADAKARQRGENLDGSPRRETIMREAA